MTSVLNCERTKELGWSSNEKLKQHIISFLSKLSKKKFNNI